MPGIDEYKSILGNAMNSSDVDRDVLNAYKSILNSSEIRLEVASPPSAATPCKQPRKFGESLSRSVFKEQNPIERSDPHDH